MKDQLRLPKYLIPKNNQITLPAILLSEPEKKLYMSMTPSKVNGVVEITFRKVDSSSGLSAYIGGSDTKITLPNEDSKIYELTSPTILTDRNSLVVTYRKNNKSVKDFKHDELAEMEKRIELI